MNSRLCLEKQKQRPKNISKKKKQKFRELKKRKKSIVNLPMVVFAAEVCESSGGDSKNVGI
jgi:hypothetical protein